MTKHRMPLWVDLRHVPLNKRLPYLHVLEEVACERLLVERGDPHAQRAGIEAVTVDGHNRLKHRGEAVGRLILVTDAKSQEKAAQAEGVVVVDGNDWRVIPLENLIAARRDRPGTLFALARTPAQAGLYAETLQTGVHGVVLAPAVPQAIVDADRELRQRWRPEGAAPREEITVATQMAEAIAPSRAEGPAASPHAFLETAEVTRVEDGGMGDRVCVDATSLFRSGEGLLVGSTARSFVLVHAETLDSAYIAARPFRVNAGAVHMYLFAPDGKTRYLSELTAGTPVLAVHPDGIHRVVRVGRAKIERRPHTLVHWKTSDGRPGMAMLQTAETIRLVTPAGATVAVTDLKPGAAILIHNEDVARHTGLPVDAELEEQ